MMLGGRAGGGIDRVATRTRTRDAWRAGITSPLIFAAAAALFFFFSSYLVG